MALGERKNDRQETFWRPTEWGRSPGHPFYDALDGQLASLDFDRQVEES